MLTKNDGKLVIALLAWTLLPVIQKDIRTITGYAVDPGIDVLGRTQWFQSINCAVIIVLMLPLLFLLKQNRDPKKNMFAFTVSTICYVAFIIIATHWVPSATAITGQYLMLQKISLYIGFTVTFGILLFVLYDEYNAILKMTAINAVLRVLLDIVIPHTGGNLTEIHTVLAINATTAIYVIRKLVKNKYIDTEPCDRPLEFMKSWANTAIGPMLLIINASAIYVLIISRIMDAVPEIDSYIAADDFIHTHMLVFIICIVPVIIKNNIDRLTSDNAWSWIIPVFGIWILSIPAWKPYMTYISHIQNTDLTMIIISSLLQFYIVWAFAVIFDAWFVSRGKTIFLFLETLPVDIYYETVYVLFKHKIFEPDLNSITCIFGFGIIVHAITAYGLYRHATKQEREEQTCPTNTATSISLTRK